MKLPALLAALLAIAATSTQAFADVPDGAPGTVPATVPAAPPTAAPAAAPAAAPELVAPSPVAPATAASRLDVGLVLGLFSPVGSLGVELQYEINDWLALSGGVGLGFSGPQAAVMPRLYTKPRKLRGFAGAGVSVGNYDEADICIDGCPVDDDGSFAVWGNAEGGIEYQPGNVFLRLTAGGGWILNSHPDRDNEEGTYLLPYAAFTIGGSI